MTNELSMFRGDTKTFRVTVKNNDEAFDLSGYTSYLTVKSKETDPDSSALIGPVTGTIVVAEDGTVDFEITSTLSNVDAGTYDYDIEVTDGTEYFTVISSTFTIKMDVTRTDELSDQELYITPLELRTYLQFDTNDYPSEDDMRFIIKISQINVDLDLDTSNTNILFIATLLHSRYQIMKSLASRSISKGYVQVNAEGRTITKAYQEFVLDAENSFQEYKEFILKNGRREATSTNFMNDTTIIDSWTRTEIINMMNGTTNAEQFNTYFGYSRYN